MNFRLNSFSNLIKRVMTMSYRPSIQNVSIAGSNEKEGLYEFAVKLADGTQCRVFYHRFPEWRLTNINRLQKTPCPVCRKDYICNCMEGFAEEFHSQLVGDQWIEKLLAE
ncbi:hypothetical protein GCM10010913_47420 [Paenibacillus aceti]|uniref:Zinc-ribbon domain-containing protein n=2 Tax=Paenibacillus aceti TaxID=1820010 RepID=A0ABQ1W8Q2_9BACL|nr:hypothetical protein GCM10010913_47420 [Paenibacillus aceti]